MLSSNNVCSEKKNTKCSNVLLLRLVSFFSERTLVAQNSAISTITHKYIFLIIFRRVHVTPATLEHLRGEYEVEPGNGHLRNEHIGSLGNFN